METAVIYLVVINLLMIGLNLFSTKHIHDLKSRVDGLEHLVNDLVNEKTK